ncbi:hypothetical protein [Pelagibaculum spongiae]|uniref:hypothetical protein n=1 Tax=Pelagibaculum spongiae TaxID=2080658 RepID=UPI0010577E56|nr:hypothetical protein [Pelagibaculum spongiae]
MKRISIDETENWFTFIKDQNFPAGNQDMDIAQQVKLFRKALTSINVYELQFSPLKGFPADCCEIASYLLAKFLTEELGLENVMMVRGENPHEITQRHVWLKIDGMDIDITANQFPTTNKIFFVENNSQWHKQFNVFEELTGDFDYLYDRYEDQVSTDYLLILSNLKSFSAITI